MRVTAEDIRKKLNELGIEATEVRPEYYSNFGDEIKLIDCKDDSVNNGISIDNVGAGFYARIKGRWVLFSWSEWGHIGFEDPPEDWK